MNVRGDARDLGMIIHKRECRAQAIRSGMERMFDVALRWRRIRDLRGYEIGDNRSGDVPLRLRRAAQRLAATAPHRTTRARAVQGPLRRFAPWTAPLAEREGLRSIQSK
jgi:hypothetical protein